MGELTAEAMPAIAGQCRANAENIGAALARGLGSTVVLEFGEPVQLAAAELASRLSGPGLVLSWICGERATALLVGEAGGLLPAWYSAPDAAGTGRLGTLAQELGVLLLPESLGVSNESPRPSANLAETVARALPASDCWALPIQVRSQQAEAERGEASAVWWLVSPLTAPAALGEPAAGEGAAPNETAADQVEASVGGAVSAAAGPAERDPAAKTWDRLPPYARSLMRIRLPVSVELASTRLPVGRVREMVPGMIIQFNKSCEEMLSLRVGRQVLADGEAVKVGDMFGLRVTSMVLPEERLRPIRKS